MGLQIPGLFCVDTPNHHSITTNQQILKRVQIRCFTSKRASRQPWMTTAYIRINTVLKRLCDPVFGDSPLRLELGPRSHNRGRIFPQPENYFRLWKGLRVKSPKNRDEPLRSRPSTGRTGSEAIENQLRMASLRRSAASLCTNSSI